MPNVLFALAGYLLLEGLMVMLLPRTSRTLANRLLPTGSSRGRRPVGIFAVAAGAAFFYAAPEEGFLALLLPVLGFPCLAYGLMLALLGNSALDQLRETYNGYSIGQIKTLGLAELSIGALSLLALLAYVNLR